jgi:hypothetical protein
MSLFEEIKPYNGIIMDQFKKAEQDGSFIMTSAEVLELKLLSWPTSRRLFWEQAITTSSAALIHPDGRVKFVERYVPDMTKPFTGDYLALGHGLEESVRAFDSFNGEEARIGGKGFTRNKAKKSQALKLVIPKPHLLDRYINLLYYANSQKEMMHILLPNPRQVAYSAIIEISGLHGTSFIGKGLLEQGSFYASLQQMSAYR